MTMTNQIIKQNLDAALVAFDSGAVELDTSVFPVMGGSFERGQTQRDGSTYLKGTLLGWNGTVFSGEKVINLYFKKNDAAFEDMDILVGSNTNAIYLIEGRIAEVETDASDAIRLEVSDTRICLYDSEGMFEIGGVLQLKGEAGSCVTVPIKRQYTLGVAELTERTERPRRMITGIKAQSELEKEVRQQQALERIRARQAGTAEPNEVKDFVKEFEKEPAAVGA